MLAELTQNTFVSGMIKAFDDIKMPAEEPVNTHFDFD